MYSPASEKSSLPFTLPPNVLVGLYLSSVYLDFFPLNPRVYIGMDAHWLSTLRLGPSALPPLRAPTSDEWTFEDSECSGG